MVFMVRVGVPRLRADGALGLGRRLARRSTARSTGPAACRSRWRRASRPSRPRSSSARARTTGARPLLPHNSVYVLVGAGLLWFGWFGFNGGSGLTAAGRDALVHEHAARAGGDARRLDRARLRARREGDGDRRRDGDHRRLRADHAGGGLRQPDVGHAARRDRRGPELPVHRLAAADAARRDARRARRARPQRLLRDPLHRLLRAARAGTGSATGCSSATRASSGTRRRRPSRRPRTRFVGTFVLLQADRARHRRCACSERTRALGLDVTQHGEEAYVAGRRRDPDLARGRVRLRALDRAAVASHPCRVSRDRVRGQGHGGATDYAGAIYGSIIATSLIGALREADVSSKEITLEVAATMVVLLARAHVGGDRRRADPPRTRAAGCTACARSRVRSGRSSRPASRRWSRSRSGGSACSTTTQATTRRAHPRRRAALRLGLRPRPARLRQLGRCDPGGSR